MQPELIDILWVLTCAGLVFVMQAGFLCLEAGLTRTKNSINVAVKNITDFSIALVLYWSFGFALMFGTSWGGWWGSTLFFVSWNSGGSWQAVFFLFQAMFCGTAVTVISGAVAERMRFGGYIVVSVIVSALVYPLYGHWAWGGAYGEGMGWLAAKGFVDFAGSSVVHSVGGWAALATLLVVGARTGRYLADGTAQHIPGSNLPMSMLGALLLWTGWIGFNGGSVMAMDERVPGVIGNTMLAGGAGMISALLVSWLWRRYVAVSAMINGALAGLVSITASCHAVDAPAALLIGSVSALFMLASERLLERCRIDDVVGAVPVHLAGGIWGSLAVALFGDTEVLGTGLGRYQQVQVQLLGIVVCGVWAFGVTYLLLRLVRRLWPLRVRMEQEHIGLNIAEHRVSTEVLDLLTAMGHQAQTQDLSLRVPVEPFTEIGQIAQQYNIVMSKFQWAAEQRQELDEQLQDLGFLYRLRTTLGERGGTAEILARAGGVLAEVLRGRSADVYIECDGQSWDSGVGATDAQYVFECPLSWGDRQRGLLRLRCAVQLSQAQQHVLLDEAVAQIGQALEKRELEAQFVQSARLVSLGQMATGAAHELNQPLTAITATAEGVCLRLQQGMPLTQERLTEMMERILNMANRMAAAVKHMQNFGRDTAAEPSIQLSINEAVHSGLMLMESRLEVHGIALHLELESDLPLVWGNPQRLSQVFFHLLSNACDALDEKGESGVHGSWEKRICIRSLRADADEEWVVVEVEDNGIGIDDANQQRVFEPFFTTKGPDKGAGLGLSTSYSIVRDCGGRISWQGSAVGTTFRVLLSTERVPTGHGTARGIDADKK